jgi:hypothetical protein
VQKNSATVHRQAFKAWEILALFKLSGIEFSMFLFVKNFHVHINCNCLLFPKIKIIEWGILIKITHVGF